MLIILSRSRRLKLILNIRCLGLVKDSAVGSKKVTRGQLWGELYRIIIFNITHQDLGIDLMNIFQTDISVRYNGKL